MRKYASAIFTIKLKLNEDKTACIPDVPFHVYGESYVSNGKRIRLNDVKNAGLECLAKLDYRTEIYPGNPDVLVEKEIAEKHAGYMGNEWSKLKVNPKYTKHYSRTKADSLATYDKEGIKTLYDGVDKDEVTKFCQFQEKVVEVKPIDPVIIKDPIIIKEKIL